MHIEPITLTVQLSSVTPFALSTDATVPFSLSGGNTDTITLQLGATLTGTVNLVGPQGEPAMRGISSYCAGAPNADEPVVAALAPYDLVLNVDECKAEALEAATAESIFIIYKEGVQIGTITFAAGSAIGVVALTDVNVTKGDLVTILAPSNPDATLGGITFLLAS